MKMDKIKAFTLAEVLMANKAREKECLHSLQRANEPKEPSRNMKKLVAFTLAEVPMANKAREKECSHSLFRANEPKEPSRNIKKLVAFTLAEVLITLAIIGVVAAINIPVIVANYQKKMYVSQLKKSYNNLTKYFTGIMAKDGVTKVTDTVLWSKIESSNATSAQIGTGANSEFFEEFTKSFNISKAYSSKLGLMPKEQRIKYKKLDGTETTTARGNGIFLADGSYIWFLFLKTPDRAVCNNENFCNSFEQFKEERRTNTKLWEQVGYINIDVNGLKGPNIYGRDYFRFNIGNNGMLYPLGGLDCAIFSNRTCSQDDLSSCPSHWSSDSSSYGCNEKRTGHGCAGRIMEEGWQMTY